MADSINIAEGAEELAGPAKVIWLAVAIPVLIETQRSSCLTAAAVLLAVHSKLACRAGNAFPCNVVAGVTRLVLCSAVSARVLTVLAEMG